MAQVTLELLTLAPLTNALALRAWAIDPTPESRKRSLSIAASALEQKGNEIKQGETYRLGAVPNSTQAYNLAQAGDYPAALALYERILAESPNHIGARTGRIRVLTYQQKHRESIQAAQVLLAAYPEQVEAHALYGWTLLKYPAATEPSMRAFLDTFSALAHLPEHHLLVLELQNRLPNALDNDLLQKTRKAIERLPRNLRRARLEERLAQLT